MVRLAYVVTHPIQYQAPLLRQLANTTGVELKVFFLSDFSLYPHHEKSFNKTFAWDTPLVNGYDWELLPNLCQLSSKRLRRFWPHTGLKSRLKKGSFDAVWVHGWGNVGLIQAIYSAKSLSLPVLLRGEAQLRSKTIPATMRSKIRDSLIRNLLLKVDSCLYIGTSNRDFYYSFGVPDSRLSFVPYAVDNQWFQEKCAAASVHRDALRKKFGIIGDRLVLLFAAKFIDVKAPIDLLNAYSKMVPSSNQKKPYLIFAGDGPQREILESSVSTVDKEFVKFIGFQNQSEMPALYDLCDVFVLPSRFEPWGLVVNEVMNASRPVIVSTNVGSAEDLVFHGLNGWKFSAGNVDDLCSCLSDAASNGAKLRTMGGESLRIIKEWSFKEDCDGILNAITNCLNRADPQ